MCTLEFYVYFRHSVSAMNVLITVAGKASFGDLYKELFFFIIQTTLVLLQPLPVPVDSVFRVSGVVINITTVLMAVMNCIVLHKDPLHALQPSSPVIIADVFQESGYVILIMTVAMAQMKETAVSIMTICCFYNPLCIST